MCRLSISAQRRRASTDGTATFRAGYVKLSRAVGCFFGSHSSWTACRARAKAKARAVNAARMIQACVFSQFRSHHRALSVESCHAARCDVLQEPRAAPSIGLLECGGHHNYPSADLSSCSKSSVRSQWFSNHDALHRSYMLHGGEGWHVVQHRIQLRKFPLSMANQIRLQPSFRAKQPGTGSVSRNDAYLILIST